MPELQGLMCMRPLNGQGEIFITESCDYMILSNSSVWEFNYQCLLVYFLLLVDIGVAKCSGLNMFVPWNGSVRRCSLVRESALLWGWAVIDPPPPVAACLPSEQNVVFSAASPEPWMPGPYYASYRDNNIVLYKSHLGCSVSSQYWKP